MYSKVELVIEDALNRYFEECHAENLLVLDDLTIVAKLFLKDVHLHLLSIKVVKLHSLVQIA